MELPDLSLQVLTGIRTVSGPVFARDPYPGETVQIRRECSVSGPIDLNPV